MPPVITQWVPNTTAIVLPNNLIYNDANGNPVNSLYPYDYLVLVGQDLNNYINTINAITLALSGTTSQIAYLYSQVASIPAPYFTPQISPQCLGLSGTTQGIDVVLTNLLTNYCSVTSVLGTNSNLLSAVATQCQNLGTSQSFSVPRGVVGALPHWVGAPATVADTLTNLWVTVCDARAGLTQLYQDIVPTCSTVIVNFQPVMNVSQPVMNVSQPVMNVYFSGYTFIPQGFTDGGSNITITDVYGNLYTQSINVVTLSNTPVPLSITLSGTTLVLTSSNFYVTVNSTVSNSATGLTCVKNTTENVVVKTGGGQGSASCCPVIGTWTLPLVSGSTALGSYPMITGLSFTPRFVTVTSKSAYNLSANNFGLSNLNQIYFTYIPGGATINFDSGGFVVNYSGTLVYDWIAFP